MESCFREDTNRNDLGNWSPDPDNLRFTWITGRRGMVEGREKHGGIAHGLVPPVDRGASPAY